MSEPDLTRLLREHASSHSVPGSAIGVLHDGAVATAYSGVADNTTGEAVTSDTRFAVESLTKPMVAGGCSSRRGRPSRPGRSRGSARAGAAHDRLGEQATLGDLLANRSRLPVRAEFEFSGLQGDDEDVLSRFAANVATGAPTTRLWFYTNAGWCLLGRAIKTVTGLSWEEAMRANFLAPLGMTRRPSRPGRSPSLAPRATTSPSTVQCPSRPGHNEPWVRRAPLRCRR